MTHREHDQNPLVAAIRRLGAGGSRRIAGSADLIVDHGRGSYLVAKDGTRYLDVISGFGVASLGHSHPDWVKAVVTQAQRLAVTPLFTGELANYLSALADLLPETLQQIALYSGGAEAVEAAIRLAQTVTGRSGVITFSGSFHGKTHGVRYSADIDSDEAQLLAPDWLKSLAYPACEAHNPLNYQHCTESADETLRSLATIRNPEMIAAVLVEPILGTAGNIPPKRHLLRELREMCDRRGWLLILDESITGFGRTGSLFAFEQFEVIPDILILGKGMGAGFPISAVCARDELWQSSSYARPSATSSSYGANPLACAAALAALKVISDHSFLAQVKAVSLLAARLLTELAGRSPRVANPRGVGLMIGFDLVDPHAGTMADIDTCAAVFRACRDRGVLVLADVPRVRLSPPLTVTAGEVHRLFDVLSNVLL